MEGLVEEEGVSDLELGEAEESDEEEEAGWGGGFGRRDTRRDGGVWEGWEERYREEEERGKEREKGMGEEK